MQKTFVPSEWEEKLYAQWEQKGIFTAEPDQKKEAFSVILPPPNANADLHVGHAMYVYEDVMIRYNKLQGKEVLWLPGADHAGFETQFVYEKYLAKQDKSRFDFTREELFKNIWDFVMQNRDTMENQLRKLGFALDWQKKKFTMDEDIVKIVYQTFKRLYDDGLVYRDTKLVNYCWKDGTSFSDLEVSDKEVPETASIDAEGGLFYVDYHIVGGGTIQVATTRPETMFGDAAVMVNPTDKRYKDLIGKVALIPIINKEIPIIADDYVDMAFGTGAVKVTPLHDVNDFEVSKRHKLEGVQILGYDGKLMNTGAEGYDGLRPIPARLKIAEELKLEAKKHRKVIKVCYKCGKTLEPLPKEQWFVKVRPLAEKAMKAVEDGDIQVHPKRFKQVLVDWLDRFHDWNISRQIVWGIQIPAYQCAKTGEWFISAEKPTTCEKCDGCEFKQDDDTFDTWFSSSQWPFATLMAQKDERLFDYFYPTTVMETGYDILPWWVARMSMMGLYATGKVPFQHVYLHGMVRDKKGQKMSKSKGNVINPLAMVEKYGADALRATLLFQTTPGGDVHFAEDKITGMRNFANKIWNIGRLLKTYEEGEKNTAEPGKEALDALGELRAAHGALEKSAHKNMNAFEFARVFDDLYEFVWHQFADIYIERLKDEVRSGNIMVLEEMKKTFSIDLKLLHPFMPFVTEAVWKELYGMNTSIFD